MSRRAAAAAAERAAAHCVASFIGVRLVEVETFGMARPQYRRNSQLDRAVKAAGFRFVALDRASIRSGAFTLPLIDREGAP